ncbi:hypothetical protein HBI67_099320 [Parastagonospora nodorum]|nr:hypothetical protein HBH50_121370 [Parastagonospora nodorum]KAH4085758.1 hypothetical protein HBH48_153790 [Parastagonospora nodorum]KAH4963065.1 hypothetical protein HBI78_125650 [Parastagonospora nodorum]KAH4983736.1 hypothetical protein HBI76_146600 [Parastagonospora nodorum]KAH5105783.1 hypothetical protein HBH72_061810 [Parastagonospora nodorum]
MAAEYFRFMDLPAELRLMVYEFIPVTTRHCTVHGKPFYDKSLTQVVLVTKSLSCSILLASHAVCNEASPVFAVKLEILRTEPTRFILRAGAVDFFTELLDILACGGPTKNTRMLKDLKVNFGIDVIQSHRFLDKASSLLSRSASPGHGPNIALVIEHKLRPGSDLETEMRYIIGEIDYYCHIKFHGKGRLDILISTGDDINLHDNFPSLNVLVDWCGEELEIDMQTGLLEDQEWAES